MAARAQAPQKPVTLPLLALTAAAAGAAIWYGYPGLALVCAGLIAAGITYPPAQFTGKKDKRGYATPGDPTETTNQLPEYEGTVLNQYYWTRLPGGSLDLYVYYYWQDGNGGYLTTTEQLTDIRDSSGGNAGGMRPLKATRQSGSQQRISTYIQNYLPVGSLLAPCVHFRANVGVPKLSSRNV